MSRSLHLLSVVFICDYPSRVLPSRLDVEEIAEQTHMCPDTGLGVGLDEHLLVLYTLHAFVRLKLSHKAP